MYVILKKKNYRQGKLGTGAIYESRALLLKLIKYNNILLGIYLTSGIHCHKMIAASKEVLIHIVILCGT